MLILAALAVWAAILYALVPWSLVATLPIVAAYASHVWRIWKVGRTPTPRGPRFFTAEMRRLALARQGASCRYCGPIIGTTVHYEVDCPNGIGGCPDDYQADHLISWDDGGQTVEANLVVACRWCNQRKSAMAAESFLAWLYSPEGIAALDARARVRGRG